MSNFPNHHDDSLIFTLTAVDKATSFFRRAQEAINAWVDKVYEPVYVWENEGGALAREITDGT